MLDVRIFLRYLRRMKRIRQIDIVKRVGISGSYLSEILNGKRRPTWQMAKRLATGTGTTPELWLDGKPAEIRRAIEAA